ncbi:MAG: PAC2 family protein [Actinomycetaceae bacterium]|nr:PAC2 family protein [Actinomycetaceae bacterium]MDY5853917.1 PAC2 family protein [Arcanobacterium sp.]
MASLIHYANDTHDLTVPRMLMNLVDPLVDAGDVAQAVAASVDSLESVGIASFDADVVYDFRAQRPIVSYQDGKLVDLAQPHMNLDLVTDMHGENFLYLSGQEPDFRWNTLTQDLLSVVKRFGVREVFSFAGMPAGVPHTRPADMLIRTTTRTDVQFVPGSADHFSQLQDFFEFHAGRSGVSVTNIRVRVPFYMAKGPHPFISGALAVIKMTANLGGPTLPLGDLEQLEDEQLSGLNQMVEEGSDFAQLLSRLEEEYDKLPSNAGVTRPADILPPMPTSEEIAQAAEQFLASLAKDPLRQAKDEGERHGAPEPEKRKDGGQGDFEAEQHAGLRAAMTGRLRRGKHHKD